MRKILTGLGCFILLILLLPLGLIFSGPLLILAALRGRQPAGPITLDTEQYGLPGRLAALLAGLALWLLVWGGLAWVVVNGFLAGPEIAGGASTLSAPLVIATPNNPRPAAPTPTPRIETQPKPFTPTPALPTPPSTATSTPAGLSSTPALTVTPAINAASPTVAPTSQAGLALTSSITTPLTPADRETIVTTVEEGNLLLREAISLANEQNLQKLETIWQGQALTKSQNFAADIYRRYAKPFEVKFEYLTRPAISQSEAGQLTVVSRETWTYQGQKGVESESFEFVYRLAQTNERWVIIQYSYRNLPAPTVTPTATATSQP
jgi:hypothetical protein